MGPPSYKLVYKPLESRLTRYIYHKTNNYSWDYLLTMVYLAGRIYSYILIINHVNLGQSWMGSLTNQK